MANDKASPERPDTGTPPQRSTRAPAEGADPRAEPDYDHTQADAGGQPLERSPRDPAEGAPEDEASRGQRVEHSGSGNSLGDGRTAGGAENAHKRDQLTR
jgi:hypothetical protein